MKYGMRERISGAIIIVALGVIFIPMLFDDPAPRDSQQTPVLTIDQPVEVEHTEVDDPQPPSSLGDEASSVPDVADDGDAPGATVTDDALPDADVASPDSDPIAELAQSAASTDDTGTSAADDGGEPEPGASNAADGDENASATTNQTVEDGQWAVQAGSFREAGNAERLEAQLDEQGFTAYRRERDDDLTTVYVGPFGSSDDGEQAMNELKERANIQGLLVRVQED
ncbi:SPOR domain-containing protein [Aidingimonas lacisalsi]|uniref:SPOR domain-containing protein n=1 Tax=Aidingimonas lacisalsi TaxID=2604086 RepID=UPI0011D282F3|nr:SPOR domain-containing protein [Aidingimonas lacisalsi]